MPLSDGLPRNKPTPTTCTCTTQRPLPRGGSPSRLRPIASACRAMPARRVTRKLPPPRNSENIIDRPAPFGQPRGLSLGLAQLARRPGPAVEMTTINVNGNWTSSTNRFEKQPHIAVLRVTVHPSVTTPRPGTAIVPQKLRLSTHPNVLFFKADCSQ
ncbi:uncharacterized protein K460DRAFT_416985 [Cucurbitaria berberidis CBS 394.84]|uniref:Uncharacterized protein n=1 Tax=Cucurbitaria berberidis CBS 394.84 TaxID=1168544 RepID=A0A9P4GIK3_9PLEO|nr:uncharacterized protein K460DRAFT_416985 [Cucurbitaria berberidis CBS 394.84]KAF1845785.1 hypothetical protein K460DRAFT_416985 [Cucurbitaria berberidis CBS 394.84]